MSKLTQSLFLDLVCGMELTEKTKYESEYKDKTYFFCSESCKDRFEINPEKYIK